MCQFVRLLPLLYELLRQNKKIFPFLFYFSCQMSVYSLEVIWDICTKTFLKRDNVVMTRAYFQQGMESVS